MTPAFLVWYFYMFGSNEDVDSHYYSHSRNHEFFLSKAQMLDEYYEDAVADAVKHFERQSVKGQRDAVSAYRTSVERDIDYANNELKEIRKWRRKRS